MQSTVMAANFGRHDGGERIYYVDRVPEMTPVGLALPGHLPLAVVAVLWDYVRKKVS
jgi:hypothetical protein